jgi:O-antigen/teichoic acid export membrane protein
MKLRDEKIFQFLLRAISGTFALNIIGRLLGFGLIVLLARVLELQDFGFYVLAWSWIQLLMVFGKFGSDATASKYIAVYKANEEWDAFHGYLRFGALIVLIKSLGISLLAAGVVWFLQQTLGPVQSITFWLVMVILPFLTLIHYGQAVLRALGYPVLGILTNTVLRPASQIVFVLGGVVVGVVFNAPVAMIISLLAAILAFILVFWGIKRSLRLYPFSAANYTKKKEWYSYAFYILLIAGGDMLFRQMDTVMLGVLSGAEEAGLYGAASRIAYFVIFGVSAANFVVTPLISEFHSTGASEKLQNMTTYAARIIFVLALGISMVLLLAGEYVLGLFGSEFQAASLTLKILIIGQLITALVGPVGSLMIMTGHEKQTSLIFLVTAGVNLLLNVWLIPLYGLEGAAIATAISFVLWNIAALVYLRRDVKINPTIFRLKGGTYS